MPAFDRSLIPASPDLAFENPLWEQGWLPAGLDEAGRGAWAGPVVAAAVILPADSGILSRLMGVRDSKELSPDERTRLADVIKGNATWATGFASNEEIDSIGILPATRLAMARSLASLRPAPACLLIDALFLPDIDIAQTALIKGDQRSLSIAAASILAKTTRDSWMVSAAEEFPGYGLERHKGYGTKLHQASLAQLGPCAYHRKSFQPIRSLEYKTRE